MIWLQASTSLGLRGTIAGGSYRDFGSFWASGDAANRGLDPYEDYALTRDVHTPAGERDAVNLNPPVSVLLFQPLAYLDPEVAFRGWQLASVGVYALVVAWLLRAFPATGTPWLGLVLLVWAPLWSTLDLGQVYVPLLALAAVAFVTLDRRPLLAGACIGLLVAIKPQYAIWPVLLLAAGAWRPAVTGVGTAAVASALPLALSHANWYPKWIAASLSMDTLVYSDNLSLPSLLFRARVPTGVSIATTAAWLAVLVAVVALRRWPARRASSVALVAAVLAGPVSWVGYALLLAPVLVSTGLRSERMTLAALLLSVPGVVLWSSHAGFLVYDAALALCLWAVLVQRREGPLSHAPAARERMLEIR